METLKKCFFITPIGEDDSDERKELDGLKVIIDPIVEEFGYNLIVANDITEMGSIPDQIIKHLIKDELAIVNLTGLNANVMYELAVRHATRKPVIHIKKKDGVKIPFDISSERTIYYNDNYFSDEGFKKRFREVFEIAIQSNQIDNPVTRCVNSLYVNELLKEKNMYNNSMNSIHEQLKNIIQQLTFTHLLPSANEPIQPTCIISVIFPRGVYIDVNMLRNSLTSIFGTNNIAISPSDSKYIFSSHIYDIYRVDDGIRQLKREYPQIEFAYEFR